MNCTRLREKIEAVFASAPIAEIRPQDIPRVVVILGSPRSGSGLLFHLLSGTGAFWSPQGDETPFYRLAGLGWVKVKEQSDAIRVPLDEPVRAAAFRLLSRDLGRGTAAVMPGYAGQVAARILLQWPQVDFEPDELTAAVNECLSKCPLDPFAFWLELTQRLALESGFYDLPGPRSRNLQLEVPDVLLEAPPFIIQTPRQLPSPDGLRAAPLLLKSTANVYRLQFLRTLFPETEFRFIIVARAPANAISSLMDGWLSNGFHSHNLEFVSPLKIKGYSDCVPLADRWWKFDLPPGWADYDDAPLADVCAFQWRSAYNAIFTGRALEAQHLIVQQERLADRNTSGEVLEQIFDFCGVRPKSEGVRAPITNPSRRTRREEIAGQLADPRIRELAGRLGYDT